jgi:hypothetical protein
MTTSLSEVMQTLRSHEAELRQRGVRHAAVFGSLPRGEAQEGSEVDVLIELDTEKPMGVFEYASLRLYVSGLLGIATDVVNRKTLKTLLREPILHDAVHAF